jgi:hypothetical protein
MIYVKTMLLVCLMVCKPPFYDGLMIGTFNDYLCYEVL